MKNNKQNIAIFDLDETLTKKGTWGRFVALSIKSSPWKWPALVVTSLFRQVLYMAKFAPREHVKESMMRRTISGKSKAELQKLAERFADNEIANGLRLQAKDKIEYHRQNGDRIIIASAAVDLIVEPIAKKLGIDEVVCTKMAWENGRLAKKLGGMNCYGDNKLLMVKQYLEQDEGYNREQCHITIYSDSRSDLALMRWADVGIAVNPSPRLLKEIPKYGFALEDWDKSEG